MNAEIIALISAAFFALGNVIARIGLKKHASPFSSTVMFVSGSVALWAVIILGGLSLPSTASLPFFAIRGILDPGIAALLVFIAMRKIGVAITIPIIASSTLFVAVLSVAFLGESLTFFVVAGTLLIVGGVSLLSLNHVSIKGNARYIWVAITGSLFIGGANVATKVALNVSNTPVSGLAFAVAVGLALHFAIIAFRNKWTELPLSFKSSRIFLLAGVFIAAAFALSFFSFSKGLVSVVYPLVSTQPLFALFFSYVLLRKDERITAKVILGTVMVVAGAVLLTAF